MTPQLEFALTHWSSGKLSIPTSTDGHFSAENWGDKLVRDPRQPKKTIKQVKVLAHFEHVKQFSEDRWETILDGARVHLKKRKQKVKLQHANVVELDERPVMASSD